MSALLCKVALSEEESMLSGATVSITYGQIDCFYGCVTDDFISGSFRTPLVSDNDYEKSHFTVDLKQSMKVVTIFLLNNAETEDHQRTIGESSFRLGNSSDSDQNGVIVSNVTDGGFFEVPENAQGRYLTIGKD